jgi:hypothetical protein
MEMIFEFSGLATVLLVIGGLVLGSTPVWLGARIVDADWQSLGRSMTAVAVASGASLLCVALAGSLGLWLAPLFLLLSVKFVLGTSFFGAMVVAFVAQLGYMGINNLAGDDVASMKSRMDEWSCSNAFPLERRGCEKHRDLSGEMLGVPRDTRQAS